MPGREGLEAGDLLPSGRYRLAAPVPNAKGAFGQVFEGQTVGGDSPGVRLAIKMVSRPCLADPCVVVPCPGLTPTRASCRLQSGER